MKNKTSVSIFIFFAFVICSLAGFLLYSCSVAGPGGNTGGGGSSGGSSSSSGSLVLDPGVYVATNGNDGNSGTNAMEPLLSIQTAIQKTVSLGLTNIFVARGVYKPGSGLNSVTNGVMITNSGLALYGGFSADFTDRNGKSALDGTNDLFHVMSVSNSPNIIIDGFAVQNGKATGTGYNASGGGLNVYSSLNVLVTNVTVSNNSAATWGSGVFLSSSTNVVLAAVISSNSGAAGGAGVTVQSGVSNAIVSDVLSNRAQNHGGGIAVIGGRDILIGGSIIGNSISGAFQGGGIYCVSTNVLITNAMIIGNSGADGGGIAFRTGAYNCVVMGGRISNNVSTGRGGGINIYQAQQFSIDTEIILNSSALDGGGIFSRWSKNIQITGSLLNNTSAWTGGGIYFLESTNASFSGLMTGNSAPSSAIGAIFFEQGNNLQIRDSVLTNNWDGGNAVIGVITAGPVTISNNIIGGTNGYPGLGILEGFAEGCSNQTLMDNVFITNRMINPYYDTEYGILNMDQINSVNINGTNFTGAAFASGNRWTNF